MSFHLEDASVISAIGEAYMRVLTRTDEMCNFGMVVRRHCNPQTTSTATMRGSWKIATRNRVLANSPVHDTLGVRVLKACCSHDSLKANLNPERPHDFSLNYLISCSTQQRV